MSLAAQSVFKLHEKFMSFIEATSTHYHHILSCLGNRFLLGAGEDGRGEVGVRKNSSTQLAHQSSPPSLTNGPTSFTNGTSADIWGRGRQHQRTQSTLIASSCQPLNFLELMGGNHLCLLYIRAI